MPEMRDDAFEYQVAEQADRLVDLNADKDEEGEGEGVEVWKN